MYVNSFEYQKTIYSNTAVCIIRGLKLIDTAASNSLLSSRNRSYFIVFVRPRYIITHSCTRFTVKIKQKFFINVFLCPHSLFNLIISTQSACQHKNVSFILTLIPTSKLLLVKPTSLTCSVQEVSAGAVFCCPVCSPRAP